MFSCRSFFAHLAALPLVGGLFAAAKAPEPDGLDRNDRTLFHGYKVFWTGWKMAQNTDAWAGQWVGYPILERADKYGIMPLDPSRPCLVAPVPGFPGVFAIGDCFDIAVYPSQRFISHITTEKEKDRQRDKGWRRLRKMIELVESSSTRNVPLPEWNQLFESKGVFEDLLEARSRNPSYRFGFSPASGRRNATV